MAEITNNWRDHAIGKALQAESMEGNGLPALLREVRRHLPHSATLAIWPNRFRLARFLREHTANLESLLSGANIVEDDDEFCAYLGWWSFEWQGASFELALSPMGGGQGPALCITRDQATLERFSRAYDDHAIKPLGRALRYSYSWTDAPDLDAEIGKVTWDDLVLPSETMHSLREAIEGFVQHQDAFRALGFPWRRGILLVGPPGTGKTMICKATAAALPDLPFLYVRDLREMHGADAINVIFARARKLAPCILVFEDIEGLVMEDHRTVFLNEMDGFGNNEGLLIIASWNHPGRIDEALLKRPSRFDRVFHMGLPARPERREYCRRILARTELSTRLSPGLDIESLAERVAERTNGFTPAYLKEVFVSAALHQAQQGIMILDERFVETVLTQTNELRKYLRRMRDPEALAELSVHNGAPIGFRPRTLNPADDLPF